MNLVVSLMYEGRFFTYGCSHLSTNWDIFSVMLSQLETIYGPDSHRVFVYFL